MIRLALASAWNRRVTTGLTVLAVALSVAMLLGVEKLRHDARDAFTNTISGTDLIVGARGGAVQLLLYSVFRLGNAGNNISWTSVQEITSHPRVSWAVPISLGDSHRGYRVMGTTQEYFRRYRYAGNRELVFADGMPFNDVYDAVMGAEVAARLGYKLGDSVVVAHGTGAVSFTEHDDKPFRIVGILAPTGTPVDRTVHVTLEGIEAIHLGWQTGVPLPAQHPSAEESRHSDLTPKSVTAVLVGLTSRISVFAVQRFVNEYRSEPLQAIIPGVALQELWQLLGVAENALRTVSIVVVLTGLLGMLTVLLATLEARRREMAILRSVGARPMHVLTLFVVESGALTLAGIGCGVALMYLALLTLRPLAASTFGLHLPISTLSSSDLILLGAVAAAGLLAGIVPALRAYRLSLADGLCLRT